MQSISLGQLQFQKKSKRKAGDGNSLGTFRFFTSSQQQSKWLEEADFMGPALIFGTGGSASIHYCNESFSSSTDCFVLKSDRDDIDMKYIYYFLRTNISILDNGFKGAGLKHISKEYLSEINIPLPSIEEQKSIIAKLDKLIELIELKKEAIGKTEALTKSVFLEMFGDPVINPKKWSIFAYGEVGNIQGGATFKSPDFVSEGIPVIKIGTINKGYFDTKELAFLPSSFLSQNKKYLLYPGDILITLTGTIGKDDYGNVFVLNSRYPEYLLNQRVGKLIVNKDIVNPLYLLYLFKVPKIKSQIIEIDRGVRQANISNSDILELRIPIPPIELQKKFSDFLQFNNSIIENQKHSLQKLQELYNTTTQDIFSF